MKEYQSVQNYPKIRFFSISNFMEERNVSLIFFKLKIDTLSLFLISTTNVHISKCLSLDIYHMTHFIFYLNCRDPIFHQDTVK